MLWMEGFFLQDINESDILRVNGFLCLSLGFIFCFRWMCLNNFECFFFRRYDWRDFDKRHFCHDFCGLWGIVKNIDRGRQ